MNLFDAVKLKEIPEPIISKAEKPVMLSDETMQERKAKLLAKMQSEKLDVMLIYGDLEHGSNFEYLTGFLPRFEEALLVVHKNGTAYLLLGNENLNKAGISRIKAKAVHVPYFSLPNQPMQGERSLIDCFEEAGIQKGMQLGVVGWKMFTSQFNDNTQLFDLPYYIVQALETLVGRKNLMNRCDLFIGAEGIRTINNANELAHYEFGSALASDGMLAAMNMLAAGVSEMELGQCLNRYGQRNSVVTIAAAGERFVKANLYPTDNQVKLGDKISLTVGYKGGLSSRSGYALYDETQLTVPYLDGIAKPYYYAVAAWLENIQLGMSGDAMYQKIEQVLPKHKYHWHLNPGHLCADEEWLSSPIFEGSTASLKSGMLLQIDIIPSVEGLGGASCESGIALADAALRNQLKQEYPALYETFMKRRAYISEVLGIHLHSEVLPMNDTVAYYRPLMLNKKLAFVKE